MIYSERKYYISVFIIFFIAFFLRLLFNSGFGYGDDYEYVTTAYDVFVMAKQPSNIAALRMGMVFIAGLILILFGVKFYLFTYFMIVLSIINLFLLYKIASVYFNKIIGLSSILLFTFLPIELLFSTRYLPDPIIMFFFQLSLLFYLSYLKSENSKHNFTKLFLVGFFIGLSYSIKEISLLFIIPIFLCQFLNKKGILSYIYIISGILLILLLEFFYSYMVWGNALSRYLLQVDLIQPQSDITSKSDMIERFFIQYPLMLLHPLQRSGNYFGYYYIVFFLLLFIGFKDYVIKKNSLTLFIISVFGFLFVINFAIISFNPLIPMLRPQSRYLIPINSCLCIIISKILYDKFYLNSRVVYYVILFFLVISSLFQFGIILNSSSPTTFNKIYYYQQEATNFITNNNLVQKSNKLYCTHDMRNYLNLSTEFKFTDKILSVDSLTLNILSENVLFVINTHLLEESLSDINKLRFLSNLINSNNDLVNVIFVSSKSYNLFSSLIKGLEINFGFKYFKSYISPSIIIFSIK